MSTTVDAEAWPKPCAPVAEEVARPVSAIVLRSGEGQQEELDESLAWRIQQQEEEELALASHGAIPVAEGAGHRGAVAVTVPLISQMGVTLSMGDHGQDGVLLTGFTRKFPWRERMIAFYAEYNIGKTEKDIDELLRKFKGREIQLWTSMQRKYNASTSERDNYAPVLSPGCRIVSVAGQPTTSYRDVQRLIKRAAAANKHSGCGVVDVEVLPTSGMAVCVRTQGDEDDVSTGLMWRRGPLARMGLTLDRRPPKEKQGRWAQGAVIKAIDPHSAAAGAARSCPLLAPGCRIVAVDGHSTPLQKHVVQRLRSARSTGNSWVSLHLLPPAATTNGSTSCAPGA